MKNLMAIGLYLILTSFFMLSCSSTPTQSSNNCSKSNLTGDCNDGKVCIDGECILESEKCSTEFPSGVCENENDECVEGECKPKMVESCDNIDCGEHGECGVFTGGAKCICDNGYIADGLTCKALCSVENPDGFCEESDEECVSGECKPKVVETCDNIDCGGHGECGVFSNGAKCVCDTGYVADGLTCVLEATVTCKEDSCTEINRTVCSVENEQIVCSCDEGYVLDDTQRCVLETVICQADSCTEPNKTVCSIENNEIVCSCDNGYHLEADICKSNTKLVDCLDNIPDNATKIDEQVEITYTDGSGWSIADTCDFTCNTDFHRVNNLCNSNTKMVDCIEHSPNNSTTINEQVEVIYTEGVGWAMATDCAFNCNLGYAGDDCSSCDTNYQDNDNNGTCVGNCSITNVNCVGNSVCDDSTGEITCNCFEAYIGDNCTECADGYILRSGICALDCSSFLNTEANTQNNNCVCKDGYIPSGNIGNCFNPCETNTCTDKQECIFDNEGVVSCICNPEDGLEDDNAGNCQCMDVNATYNTLNKDCRCNQGYSFDSNGVCVNSCVVDEITLNALNNTAELAYEIILDDEGEFEQQDLTNVIDSCETVDDWYKVELKSGDKVTVDILFEHVLNSDLDLYLYLEPSVTSYILRGYTASDNEHLEYIVKDEDIPTNKEFVTLYIKVVGYTNSLSLYSLNVKVDHLADITCNPVCDTDKEFCNVINEELVCSCKEDLGYYYNGYACSNPCDFTTCEENRTCVSESALDTSCECSDGFAEKDGVCVEISDIEGSQACVDAPTVTPGFYQGTTAGASDDLGICNTWSNSGLGGDVFYKLILDKDSYFKATVKGIGENGYRTLRLLKENDTDVCNFDLSQELQCSSYSSIGGLYYKLDAGTYYVVVDSQDNQEGAYVLELEYGNACLVNTCNTNSEYCSSTGFGDDDYDCFCDTFNGYYPDSDGNCVNPCDTNVCSYNNTECVPSDFDNYTCECKDGFHNISDTSIDCVELGEQGADTCGDTVIPIITERGIYGGTLEGSTNASVGSCGGTGYESIYELEVTEAQIVEIKELSSSFDAVLYVKEADCLTGNELICYDGFNNDRLEKFFEVGTYYLFVDAYSANETDNYILEVNFKGDPCNGICNSEHQLCQENTDNGTYSCVCDEFEGYFDDGAGSCINPCEVNNCPDLASNGTGICTATAFDEFSCGCMNGYLYDEVNNSCVNPCEPNTCPDASRNGTGICTTISISDFSCGCLDGYKDVVTNGAHECVETIDLQGANTCDSIPEIMASGWYVGTTTGMENTFNPSINKCTSYEEKGFDVVYAINLNIGDELSLELFDLSSSVDTAIYMVSDCADSENSCVAGSDNSFTHGVTEKLTYTATESGLHYIVIDAYSQDMGYDYELELSLTSD